MKILLERKFSLVLIIIQFILSMGAIGLLFYVNIFPVKYLIAVISLAIFLLAYTIFSQMTDKSKIIGRVLASLFCFMFAFLSFYGFKTYRAVEGVSAVGVQTNQISYIVLTDDKAQSLADAKDYTFGVLENIDRENTDNAIAYANQTLNTDISTTDFLDMDALIEGLYSGNVQVIIFNESFRESVLENHAMFEVDTRILDSYEMKAPGQEELVRETPEETINVTQESFNVYISGIDVYGKIAQTSRSDVNIIATVNPGTKEILLTSTPRDYYVPFANSKGERDKLTHAGQFGVKNSIKTLEMLYDTKIDYYVRINFTSMKKIVDTLGGVSVYSDYTFKSDWGPSFVKGMNKVNGKEALAFCRERHHFAQGDRQRIKNHQHMFEAILNKVVSPSFLPRYLELLDILSKNLQTNVSTAKITELAKMQLADGAKWKVSSYSVDGTGARRTTYTYKSRALYVMVPDEKTVAKAKKQIHKALAAIPAADAAG